MSHQTILTLDNDEWQLASEYVQLMWHEVQRQPLLPETIIHLQTALLLELKRIADREESQWQKQASRQDKTFTCSYTLLTCTAFVSARLNSMPTSSV